MSQVFWKCPRCTGPESELVAIYQDTLDFLITLHNKQHMREDARARDEAPKETFLTRLTDEDKKFLEDLHIGWR